MLAGLAIQERYHTDFILEVNVSVKSRLRQQPKAALTDNGIYGNGEIMGKVSNESLSVVSKFGRMVMQSLSLDRSKDAVHGRVLQYRIADRKFDTLSQYFSILIL